VKNNSSLSRLLTPPSQLVNPAPRPLPLLPARWSSLSRSHVTSRASVGDRDTHIEWKASAHTSALVCFPPHFPDFFTLVPKYMSCSPPSPRTLPPPIARPPSMLVSRVCLHANPGQHSLALGMRSGSGCRREGGQVTVAGSNGPRGTDIFKNPSCEAFRRQRTPRVVAARSCRSPRRDHRSCRLGVLLPLEV
jgi:hypothetical protein